ncbi:hypothetical protein QN277_025365 [Acacia crassicarpa]|uniref:Uncharacterized protein n=1 Tax=Acacia crassicarpa TaxID=499986 RepID=A0AAE1JHG7_9FABA|nr:hypothetical protein QN277_025365 [Acacia crassicarpa]
MMRTWGRLRAKVLLWGTLNWPKAMAALWICFLCIRRFLFIFSSYGSSSVIGQLRAFCQINVSRNWF